MMGAMGDMGTMGDMEEVGDMFYRVRKILIFHH
jgi:hypothetical protein